MRKKLTGKYPKNDFFNRVLGDGTGLDRFVLKNGVERDSRRVLAIFLDHIRARFHVFLNFPTRFFNHFRPVFLPDSHSL